MFDEFYAKLKDIVNSAFNLGETIPKPKIVRKVLKSLPERFHAKITAIEESKDINKIPLIELVGNQQTYELDLTRIGKLSCIGPHNYLLHICVENPSFIPSRRPFIHNFYWNLRQPL